ncbi:uncharacterized protein LTR77_005989 [Saxophila tyrrhenica]|uniref:SAP domain-containing protein n=1 Tax=Saxophila tyrrhenica TaxID=1690608 RepID=A0AAV9PAT2_9PEZI|nr:hypothetical protein LTR77_005989 [Saxophila tyrrhenica]
MARTAPTARKSTTQAQPQGDAGRQSTPFRYEEFLVPDLRDFLAARNLKLPKGQRGLKRELIARLRQADDEWQFRFLDLRLSSGRSSLGEDPLEDATQDFPIYWPAILRVSKEVNAEAEDVLYGMNTFRLNLAQQYERDDEVSDSINVAVETAYSSSANAASLREMDDTALPDLLLKARKLSIELSMSVVAPAAAPYEDGEVTFKDVHRQFYRICSFLAESKSPRHVNISIDATEYPDIDIMAAKILWPLVKIPATTNNTITMTGLPEETSASLLAEMRQDNSGDRMGPALKLFRRVVVLQEAIRHVRPFNNNAIRPLYYGQLESQLRDMWEDSGYVNQFVDGWLVHLCAMSQHLVEDEMVEAVKDELNNQKARADVLLAKLDGLPAWDERRPHRRFVSEGIPQAEAGRLGAQACAEVGLKSCLRLVRIS